MFTVYPIYLIDMGNELKVWRCHLCKQIHIIKDNKFKYCNCCDYKPKENMNEKNKAIELREKFDTKRDALLAIDMLITMYIAEKGIKDNVTIFYWEGVKNEINKL